MKRIITFTFFITLTFAAAQAQAQTPSDTANIAELAGSVEKLSEQPDKSTENSEQKQNDDINKSVDDAEKAQNDAVKLFQQEPNIVRLQESQKRLIEKGDERRKQLLKKVEESTESRPEEIIPQTEEEITTQETEVNEEKKETEGEQIALKYDSAPFGLFWGISKQQTDELGFLLKSAKRKDYKNVYIVENPKQKSETFETVTAIFGEEDKLWCIYAQSKPQPDTPQATNVLQLYHEYYNALEHKYGNAQQYFTPHIYTEEIQTDENDESKTETKTIRAPIGNDNFLQELQDGTAVLYATFENEKFGITLGVSVDGEGYGYISVDYKNLPIMKEEQQTKLDNLINDI